MINKMNLVFCLLPTKSKGDEDMGGSRTLWAGVAHWNQWRVLGTELLKFSSKVVNYRNKKIIKLK